MRKVQDIDKSSIFFSKNTKEEDKKYFCDILEGVVEQMVIGRSKRQIFSFIKDGAEKKIGSLSYSIRLERRFC